MGIPERLVEVREKHGYTRKRLAEELGKPYATITKYENGEREAGSEYLKLIAGKFHVTTDYLLGIEKETSPAPAEAETKEVSADQIRALFVAAGIMPDGADLTDEDLRFLRSVAKAVSAWFEQRDQGS